MEPRPPNNTRFDDYRVDAVRHLASGIAHEFANALTAISGIAHLMQLEGAVDPRAHDDLNEIREITNEAAALARELMAFGASRMTEPTRRRLSEIIKLLRRVLPHVLPSHVRLAERMEAEDTEVWADPRQIIEIAIVLAVQARETREAGELLIGAHVEQVSDPSSMEIGIDAGRYAVLEISSSGAGPQSASGVDRTNAVAEAVRVLSATGAGLSVRDTDHTRIFRIFLPVVSEPARPSTVNPSPGGTETILLLEDDEELADVVARILQARGFTVHLAGDGDSALRMAETLGSAIHLLLSDVFVPGVSGLELIRRFSAARPSTRILFMSGYTEEMGGNVPFLRKPFDGDTLLRKVRDVLDGETPR